VSLDIFSDYYWSDIHFPDSIMSKFLLWFLILSLSLSSPVRADWGDWLKKITGGDKGETSIADKVGAAGLTSTEIVAGLKEALDTATEIAVNQLGKEGGFLDNAQVRIPMPEELDWVEKSLRKIGQDRMADDFVTTMNRAAEQAVPGALGQFREAIQAMTLEDARSILNGPDDAATQYFRRQSEENLRAQFLPLIKETTASSGVTSAYKQMTGQLDRFGGLFNTQSLDVDAYVTDKTLDGLFLVVAQEEARIREDPVARSTELLKKLFGN
jgi:hypothetical protein